MLSKLAGAMAGKYVAGRNQGFKGALLGAGVAAVARRCFWPLALVGAAAYGAQKLYERRKGAPSYPSEATPSSPSGGPPAS